MLSLFCLPEHCCRVIQSAKVTSVAVQRQTVIYGNKHWWGITKGGAARLPRRRPAIILQTRVPQNGLLPAWCIPGLSRRSQGEEHIKSEDVR